MLRIFGRTTLVSQFMVRSEMRETHSPELYHMAARSGPGKPSPKARFADNCGLFSRLLGAAHALRERRHEIGNCRYRLCRRLAVLIETIAQGIDQRRAYHG